MSASRQILYIYILCSKNNNRIYTRRNNNTVEHLVCFIIYKHFREVNGTVSDFLERGYVWQSCNVQSICSVVIIVQIEVPGVLMGMYLQFHITYWQYRARHLYIKGPRSVVDDLIIKIS